MEFTVICFIIIMLVLVGIEYLYEFIDFLMPVIYYLFIVIHIFCTIYFFKRRIERSNVFLTILAVFYEFPIFYFRLLIFTTALAEYDRNSIGALLGFVIILVIQGGAFLLAEFCSIVKMEDGFDKDYLWALLVELGSTLVCYWIYVAESSNLFPTEWPPSFLSMSVIRTLHLG